MSWEQDLLAGIAEWCEAQDLGVYRPDDVGGTIELGALSDDVDQGVGLDTYNTSGDAGDAEVVQPVQFWLRGSEQWVRDTASLLFDGLHGLVGHRFGVVDCPLVEHRSTLRLGPDSRGRTERTVNVVVTAMRPTTVRPD